MKITGALFIAIALADLTSCTKDPLKSFPPSLTTVKTNLEATFISLDSNLDGSTARLSLLLADTGGIRSELKGLFANSPDYVLEYSLVSPVGIMEIIEPPVYYPMEGSDISNQDHIMISKSG